MNKIIPIPALVDNYIWCILSPDNTKAIIIDPGDATPVIDTLQKQNVSLIAILITHHHWDHTSGLEELKAHFPKIQIFGHSQTAVPSITHSVKEGDIISFPGFSNSLSVIETPGHTRDHVAYWDQHALFSGDVLFASGCGRIFEGTHQEMMRSLTKLRSLPNYTDVYCGHEYTIKNLNFALTIEPNNKLLQEQLKHVQNLRDNNIASLPTTISIEKASNPFLRFDESAFCKIIGDLTGVDASDPLAVFTALRKWKDNF